MNITKEEFMKLINQTRFGIDFGMAVYSLKCPECGERVEVQEKVYTRGFLCYMCNYYDPEWGWGPLSGEGFQDGPFLTPVGAKVYVPSLN